MRDTQELHVVNGLVRKIDAHHGSMSGAISLVIVAIVSWIALKEMVATVVNVFERLG